MAKHVDGLETNEINKLHQNKHCTYQGDKQSIKQQPNAFICFRVLNPELINSLKDVQNQILSCHRELEKTAIKPSKFHVTLALLNLNEQTSDRCVESLRKVCSAPLNGTSLSIKFNQLRSFNSKVLYADVEINNYKQLEDLHDSIVKQLEQDKISLFPESKNSTFTPHLTIFKLSKDIKLRFKGYRKFPKSITEKFSTEAEIGTEHVQKLYICEIASNSLDDENDDFYKTIAGRNIQFVIQIVKSLQILLSDDNMVRELSTFDIAVLCETFCTDSMSLNGFYTVKTCASLRSRGNGLILILASAFA
ncbi:hypothetical protein GJ496_010998 [Pomphorhynchus laevis]|nr:hypothetical protein GJ496_010998 [Pomphorhynchus laevis]